MKKCNDCEKATQDIENILIENRVLRTALEEVNKRDTYSAKSYGPFAEIARAALAQEKFNRQDIAWNQLMRS